MADRTRILDKKPVEIDKLVGRWVGGDPDRKNRSFARQLLTDAAHFGISLGNEMACLLAAAPNFVNEFRRDGLYPDRMTFRKLPFRPEMSDLNMLRSINPAWEFREDFDPRRWVFVFLHGYVDNTGADRIAYKLAELGYEVYLIRYPFLRHVESLAEELEEVLEAIACHELGKRLVPIGHSLGGCIWDHLLLHNHEIVERYDIPLYIPLGSPHFGTLAAYMGVGASARDMMPHSALIADHLRRKFPPGLEIYPFVSRFDMLVLPVETALLKRGINYVLSETGHVAQIVRSAIVTAIEEVISTRPDRLRERAEYRPFRDSGLTAVLRRMPRSTRERIGIQGVLDYLDGDNGEPAKFYLRIVHHELALGLFPALKRPRDA